MQSKKIIANWKEERGKRKEERREKKEERGNRNEVIRQSTNTSQKSLSLDLFNPFFYLCLIYQKIDTKFVTKAF